MVTKTERSLLARQEEPLVFDPRVEIGSLNLQINVTDLNSCLLVIITKTYLIPVEVLE